MAGLESLGSLPKNPNRVFPVGSDLLAVVTPDQILWKVNLCELRYLPEFEMLRDRDRVITDLFKIASAESLAVYGQPKSGPKFDCTDSPGI